MNPLDRMTYYWSVGCCLLMFIGQEKMSSYTKVKYAFTSLVSWLPYSVLYCIHLGCSWIVSLLKPIPIIITCNRCVGFCTVDIFGWGQNDCKVHIVCFADSNKFGMALSRAVPRAWEYLIFVPDSFPYNAKIFAFYIRCMRLPTPTGTALRLAGSYHGSKCISRYEWVSANCKF